MARTGRLRASSTNTAIQKGKLEQLEMRTRYSRLNYQPKKKTHRTITIRTRRTTLRQRERAILPGSHTTPHTRHTPEQSAKTRFDAAAKGVSALPSLLLLPFLLPLRAPSRTAKQLRQTAAAEKRSAAIARSIGGSARGATSAATSRPVSSRSSCFPLTRRAAARTVLFYPQPFFRKFLVSLFLLLSE